MNMWQVFIGRVKSGAGKVGQILHTCRIYEKYVIQQWIC